MKNLRAPDRLQQYFNAQQWPFKIITLPETAHTAQQAAEALGCEIGQIAKSLVFQQENHQGLVIIIASGKNRVDLEKIRQTTGYQLIRAEGKSVKSQVGFAIGGIPPFGHLEAFPTLLDQDLLAYTQIWAAGGAPETVFQLTPTQLETYSQGIWMDLAERT